MATPVPHSARPRRRSALRHLALAIAVPLAALRAQASLAAFDQGPAISSSQPVEATPPSAPAILSGRFKILEKGVPIPGRAEIRILTPLIPPANPLPPRRAFRCPVFPEPRNPGFGSFRCPLPPGNFDLAIGARAFVPHLRRGVEVLPGRPLDLGTLELERSGSVRGTIEVEGGTVDPARCLVRVAPVSFYDKRKVKAYQGDPSLIVRAVGRDGSFRIENVAAGTWQVEVRQPGFATAVRSPVTVGPGGSVALPEAFVLRRRFDLELTILPPVDSRGERWSVHAGRWYPDREDGKGRDLYPQETGKGTGIFRAPQQKPGQYWIEVDGSAGESVYVLDQVEIDNASEGRRTIDLRGLAIEGELRYGGRPTQASAIFESPDGVSYAQVQSGEKGRFRGRLPGGEGSWRVTVRWEENAIPVGLSVEVREDRPGHATVDLDLPETRLFGRVVDERGDPEPGIVLRIQGEGRVAVLESADLFGFEDSFVYDDGTTARKAVRRWTNRPFQLVEAGGNGEFDLRHPPAGRLLVRPLRADDGYPGVTAGEAVEVAVEAGRPTGPVTVRTRAAGHLRGTVRKRGLPALAGLSLAYAGVEDGEPLGTDENGDFELDLPAGFATVGCSEPVILVLLPEEGALRVRTLRLPQPGSPVQLEVEEVAGALRVDLPSSWIQMSAQAQTLEIEQDGVVLPLDELFRWVKANGIPAEWNGRRDLTVPGLPAGHYRICVGPTGLGAGIDPGAPKGTVTCDEGDLEAGRDLRLDLRR